MHHAAQNAAGTRFAPLLIDTPFWRALACGRRGNATNGATRPTIRGPTLRWDFCARVYRRARLEGRTPTLLSYVAKRWGKLEAKLAALDAADSAPQRLQ